MPSVRDRACGLLQAGDAIEAANEALNSVHFDGLFGFTSHVLELLLHFRFQLEPVTALVFVHVAETLRQSGVRVVVERVQPVSVR